jgi:hypothetical protein
MLSVGVVPAKLMTTAPELYPVVIEPIVKLDE